MILILTDTDYSAQPAEAHRSAFGPMPEGEARAKVAGWVARWRALGHTVREGDGWATCTTVWGAQSVYLASAAAFEEAEARADIEYDAHVNR